MNVDPDNLRTASLYINNQLLSRGLLRDGQNINFIDPALGDGGAPATMGRIMSVVNDLILRRDRDAQQRESLSSTLRTLRAESLRQTTDQARQQERLADTQRKLDSADATERALRGQLKSADASIHKLKDEMAKMRALVAQTRSACANETRKRDRQIDALKKSLTDAARVRGGGKSRDIMCISVTGEVGGDERAKAPAVGATDDEGYTLRMETNEFLTELAKGLSDENEGMLSMLRHTVDSLSEMSGLGRTSAEEGHDHAAGRDALAQQPPKGAAELTAELETIVDHLRNILTNPSFVPIEEVEVREEEINRLRAGMDRMETRWKDAVVMIDGWRRRMGSGGQTVNMEELSMGLRLSPVRVRDVDETREQEQSRLSCVQEEDEMEEEGEPMEEDSHAESLNLVPAPAYEVEEADDDSDASSIFQDDVDFDGLDDEEPNVQVLQESVAFQRGSSPLPEPPELSPLKDSYTSGNRGPPRNVQSAKGHGDFTTIVEENTWDLAAADPEAPPPPPHGMPPRATRQHASSKTSPTPEQLRPSQGNSTSYESPLFGKSGERPSQTDPSKKLFSKPSTGAQQLRNKPEAEFTSPVKAQTSAPISAAKKPAVTQKSPLQNAAAAGKTAPEPSRSGTATKRAAPDMNAQPAKRRSSLPLEDEKDERHPEHDTSMDSSRETSESVSQPLPRNRSPIRNANNTAAAPAGGSRLPRPNAAAPPQSPVSMDSIAAKLAATEREADAARVRAKLKAARTGRNGGSAASTATTRLSATSQDVEREASPEARKSQPRQQQHHSEPQEMAMDDAAEDVDPVKKRQGRAHRSPEAKKSSGWSNDDEADELAGSMGSFTSKAAPAAPRAGGMAAELRLQAKRKRDQRISQATSRRASRRRSTLSPWELESLITGAPGPDSPIRKV